MSRILENQITSPFFEDLRSDVGDLRVVGYVRHAVDDVQVGNGAVQAFENGSVRACTR